MKTREVLIKLFFKGELRQRKYMSDYLGLTKATVQATPKEEMCYVNGKPIIRNN